METDKTLEVINNENGDYVTTNSWKPLLRKVEIHYTADLPLNFKINWKTALSELSQNITTR